MSEMYHVVEFNILCYSNKIIAIIRYDIGNQYQFV